MKPIDTRPALLLAAALGLGGGVAAADDAGLPRCRAIADPTARLACYDALPLAAGAPAPPAAAASALAAQRFGQPRRDEAEAISSHIAGDFEGWEARTRITLANGQVWQVIDDSLGVYALKSPRVTVRRAPLGGFVMDIEGANRMPRVRRVQ